MTKRKGERGSPCLMPRVREKGHEGMPFTRKEKLVEVIRLITHRTQVGLKPKAVSICWIYSQLSLSKAFERSSFRSIPPCFEWLRVCMISCERMTPSIICLPSTYPDCSREMIIGRSGFNLFAMTLEMTLYITLESAIVWTYLVWSSPPLLGLKLWKWCWVREVASDSLSIPQPLPRLPILLAPRTCGRKWKWNHSVLELYLLLVGL